MKQLYCLGVCIIISLQTSGIKAQCINGETLQALTYDSIVSGVGTAGYNFTFPKFDPSLGTLLSIRVQSVVSIQYRFELENFDAAGRNVRHRLTRFDEVYSDALLDPIDTMLTSSQFGPYALAASDGIAGSGTDYIAVGPVGVLNMDTTINRTVYNVGDFLGPGTISFDYFTSPGSNFTGGIPAYTASIADQIKFNITYIYCPTLVLAPENLFLTAENSGPLQALLNWKTNNELNAKSYQLLVSRDGQNFTTAGLIPADGSFTTDQGSYSFKYNLIAPADKLYFRIRQITKNNRVMISPVRTVAWSGKVKTISFIPNQNGAHLTVQLPIIGPENWKVDLLGINGQLIQESKISSSTTSMIPIRQKLASGVYVVRAINISTMEIISKKILIH